MRFTTWIRGAVFAATVVLLLPAAGMAQTTWNGGTGNWFDGTLWDSGSAPGITDDAVIDGDPGVNSVVNTGVGANISVQSLTVGAGDTLNIDDNTVFGIVETADPASGQVTNDGQINIESIGGSVTDLVVNDAVDFSGSGQVTLDGAAARIVDRVGANGVLTNGGGHTINGFGQLGVNSLAINNLAGGTIDANVSGEDLIVDASVGGLTNAGTIQSSSGGNLVLTGSTVDNTGGTIVANTGSTVSLTNNTLVSGGDLGSVGTGTVEVLTTSTLQDLTLSGVLNQQDNSTLNLDGTITNTGQINLTSVSGSVTDLRIDAGATLTGGGTLTLGGDNTNSRILDTVGANGTLTHDNHTIQGFGQVGGNGLGITNTASGLIDANVSGEDLIVDANFTDGLTNAGTIQSSSGGNLVLTGSVVDNTAGTIVANTGSTVSLDINNTISGGDLGSVGTGTVEVLTTSTLQDLTLSGVLNQQDNSRLNLDGTITNTGQINLTSVSGGVTDLRIDSSATLTGGGTLTLGGDNTNSRIVDTIGANGTLTNIDHTIQGFGQVGFNSLEINNLAGGRIVATNTANSLFVNSAGTITNNAVGEFRAAAGSTLEIVDDLFINGGNVFAEAGGRVNAAGALRNEGNVFAQAGGRVAAVNNIFNEVSGLLGGDGTISANEILNQGTISPGESSVGQLSIESTFVTFSSSSTFQVDIDSTGADFLDVVFGDAFLDGTLEVSLLSGFLPTAGASFNILGVGGSYIGTFANAPLSGTIATTDGRGLFDVVYATNGVSLVNFRRTAIPEPTAMVVLLGATACYSLRRRRQA